MGVSWSTSLNLQVTTVRGATGTHRHRRALHINTSLSRNGREMGAMGSSSKHLLKVGLPEIHIRLGRARGRFERLSTFHHFPSSPLPTFCLANLTLSFLDTL